MRKVIIPESWIRWWFFGSRRRAVSATRRSVTREQSEKALSRIFRASYTLHCRKRAEWRLTAKKPAEQLSSYYRFGCEYGTSLMKRWQGGGSGPLYVCEDHAKTLSSKGTRAALGTNQQVARVSDAPAQVGLEGAANG